jgi:hypothetical protein
MEETLNLDELSNHTKGRWEAIKIDACGCGSHKEHWNVKVGDGGYQILNLTEADAKVIEKIPLMVSTLKKWDKLLDRYDKLMDSMSVDLDDIVPEDDEYDDD